MAPKRQKKVTKLASKRKSRTKVNEPVSHSHQPDFIGDLIDIGGQASALTIEPAWKPAVRANLQVIFGQATLFMAFELPDDTEPAPIFKA
jgi:Protein of unknown function (DUF4089)